MLHCFILLTCMYNNNPCYLNVKYIKRVEELDRGIMQKETKTYVNGDRVKESMAEVMKKIDSCKVSK